MLHPECFLTKSNLSLRDRSTIISLSLRPRTPSKLSMKQPNWANNSHNRTIAKSREKEVKKTRIRNELNNNFIS